MTVKNNAQTEVEPKSPADYQGLDFDDLQYLTNYITKRSIPVDMTMIESQKVIDTFAALINLSLHNLNLLRALNGEPEFPIPERGALLK